MRKRLFGGFAAAMLASAMLAPTAFAAKPTRVPFTPPIPAVDTDCGYPIGIEVLTSNEVRTTFSDGDGGYGGAQDPRHQLGSA
jgi:hypothetical protein